MRVVGKIETSLSATPESFVVVESRPGLGMIKKKARI